MMAVTIKKKPKIHLPQKTKPSGGLVIIVCLLFCWGLFTIGVTSFYFSLQQYNNVWYLLEHQLLMVFIGIILGVIAYKVPLKYWQKIAPYFFLLNFLFLILVLVPQLGIASKGAQRWINIFGFTFQPSEIMKISFVLYLAAWLASKESLKLKEKSHQSFKHFLLPFLVVLAVLFIVLIKQRDMTTLAIFCVLGAIIYFSSSAPWWHWGVLGGIGGAAFFFFARLESYRWQRIVNFLHPQTDPLGKGFQVQQAAITIGSGRVLGVGEGFAFGLSRQKFNLLPEALTDSIFAVVCEELGFVGAFFLVVLFLLFLWKGLSIAKKAGQTFSGFLALGITVWITLQAFVNIGGITGILPLGGVPLPFFSYGGSHLISELMAVGLLLNASRS
jgi:cell division protein FtsW